MAKLMYGGQNLSRAPEEKSAKTSPATVLTGDTSVTIYDSRIKSSSFVRRYVAPFTDGTILGANTMNISDGQAVITFDSPAKEDTTIKLEIEDAEGFKEVTLWENPNPTSAFANQTVTLSDSLDNYNYIAISYIYTSATPATNASVALMSVEDFKKGAYNTSIGRQALGLTIVNASNQPLSRSVYYVSSTSVRFGVCYKGGVEESTTNGANPLKITGLTELNQVKIRNAKIENVLWTNPSPSASTFAAQAITLSDNLSNYDYLCVESQYANTGGNSTKNIISVDKFKECIYNTARTPVFGIAYLDGSSTPIPNIVRAITYNNSETQIRVYDCKCGSTSYNNMLIPLQIIGIKEVSTHKADIYGAAQDTIYYSTNGTDWTVVGQTDSNGYLANAELPDTAFILKSSVAKNPEDLTADYTKAFNTDSNVLRFMPDNCLYWWGYESSNLEDCTTANGWSLSGYTLDTPVHNTNSISLSTSASMHRSSISAKNAVNCSKIKVIYSGVTAYSTYGYVQIFLENNKAFNNTGGASQGDSSAMALVEHTHTSGNGNYYPSASSANTQKSTIYAIWYE